MLVLRMKKMANKKMKIPVSERALIARINRKLTHDGERLCQSRSAQTSASVGEYFILDVMRNFISHQNVELENLAKELGVLQPYECLTDSK
jgi:hypothetical protein